MITLSPGSLCDVCAEEYGPHNYPHCIPCGECRLLIVSLMDADNGCFVPHRSCTMQELLQYYPADPAAGSPYGSGNDTFGLAAQYKRLVSLVGDLIFQV